MCSSQAAHSDGAMAYSEAILKTELPDIDKLRKQPDFVSKMVFLTPR